MNNLWTLRYTFIHSCHLSLLYLDQTGYQHSNKSNTTFKTINLPILLNIKLINKDCHRLFLHFQGLQLQDFIVVQAIQGPIALTAPTVHQVGIAH
jgi:hypothetical protein